MSRSIHKPLIEPLEIRLLPTWASYAQLVHQDTAASDFPAIDGKGVTVAMIDTGIDYKLPALGGGFGAGYKVIGGYNFVDNNSDPLDTDGHGTDTAFTVAGNPITVGGITYQGVAPDAKLVALKAGTEADGFSDANLDAALKWVIANYKKYNISIVNMSLGSGDYTSAETESPESDDFAQLKQLGILVVAASGNSNEDVSSPISEDGIAFPAADPNVFAVGAVDSTGAIADFTQRGTELDLLAPGVDIVMPDITSTTGGTVTEDGTSFASPYTAGAAALIKDADPSIQPSDIDSILMSSGKDTRDGSTDSNDTTGLLFSRLNIDAALKLIPHRIGHTASLGLGSTFSTAVDSNGILDAAYYDAKHHELLFATQDAAGEWSKPMVIDASGDVGSQLSTAVDATGHPAIAYYDATNSALKYASFSGTGWSITTLDSNKTVGSSPSLGFSIYGDAYIGYYRKTGGLLRLASLDRDTGTWTVTTVDGGTYGSDNGDNVGADVSISIAEAAVRSGFFTQYDTTVALAYTDSTANDIKYARLDVVDPTATWYLATVTDTPAADIDLQLHNGPQDVGAQAQITFRDTKTGAVDYAYRYNDWFVSTVTSDKTSGNTSLTFDDNDFPIVTYYNANKGAVYSSSLSSDGSTWTPTRDSIGGSTFDVTLNDRTDESVLSLLDRKKTALTTLQLS